jgi:hypothetical protein
MEQNWFGIDVRGEEVTLLGLRLAETGEITEVLIEDTWNLQTGDRGAAYAVMFDRLINCLAEQPVDYIAVKASEANSFLRLPHLQSAELRGAVITAAAKSGGRLFLVPTGIISRMYGGRNNEQYIQDDEFWERKLTEHSIRKKSRQAAMLIFMARRQQSNER